MANETAEEKKAREAKEVAQQPAKPTPKVKGANGRVKPVVAINRINGTIEPGTPFRPNDAQELGDLEALGAVRDLTEAEESLFEKIEATDPSDLLGGD